MKQIDQLIREARARYEALGPAQKEALNYEQCRSYVRGMCPSDRNYEDWCRIVDELLPPR